VPVLHHVVLGLIARFHGFSIWKFTYIKEELLIVLGTSSSESVLPRAVMDGIAKKSVVDHDPDRILVQSRRHLDLPEMAAVFIAQRPTRR
jgi:Na+/H+-dicarboxylate symporter